MFTHYKGITKALQRDRPFITSPYDRGTRILLCFAQPEPALAAASTALRRSFLVQNRDVAEEFSGAVSERNHTPGLGADEGSADVAFWGFGDLEDHGVI